MATRFDWVEERWPGKLVLAARPRGGDWLEDETAAGAGQAWTFAVAVDGIDGYAATLAGIK